ncbi:class I SAM-dependent methyltransferase [Lentzea sp. JNUCC 0626]|uniref:class I SAM-dependent methyltransferase n=1 Tax=Lentzea sp. JNUCC 0626 TaxID=3367513 RepID=UPI0037496350
MNPEFYSKVADRFGGYSSGARRTEVFPDGDPEDAFDAIATALSGPDARLLDVGCADGRNLLRLAPRYGHVVGIDLSQEMLASAKLHQGDLSTVDFELRDAGSTGFRADYFDVITSRRGPVFPDEYRRVLRPGGSLVHLGIGGHDVRELKEVFGRGQLFGRWSGPSVELETRKSLEEAGFTVVREQTFHYEEFFHTSADLDVFLRQVPIFEDYDSVADRERFGDYVQRAGSESGIRLARHWFLLHARKNAERTGGAE